MTTDTQNTQTMVPKTRRLNNYKCSCQIVFEFIKQITTTANSGKYLKLLLLVLYCRIKTAVEDLLGVVKQSFDNDVTPFFALVICLWGETILFFYCVIN